jgi:transcriptional regulator with XRE-family HTH domain
MKTTKFTNAADAAAHLAGDPSIASEVKKEIARNEMVAALLQMRVSKGLTQEDIASEMGCDPSTISRIESGNDRQLKWSDVEGYLGALKIQMTILFEDPSRPAAERIKQCVFKIHEDLEGLAGLANEVGDDEQILNGINQFYRQVLVNFLSRFQESYTKLPPSLKVPPKPKLATTCSDESHCRQEAEAI